jgi:hypothetical protein
MLAQAINRTAETTIMIAVNGCAKRSRRRETPAAAGISSKSDCR